MKEVIDTHIIKGCEKATNMETEFRFKSILEFHECQKIQ